MTITQAKRKQSDQTWNVKYFWHFIGPHFTLYSLEQKKCSHVQQSTFFVKVYSQLKFLKYSQIFNSGPLFFNI